MNGEALKKDKEMNEEALKKDKEMNEEALKKDFDLQLKVNFVLNYFNFLKKSENDKKIIEKLEKRIKDLIQSHSITLTELEKEKENLKISNKMISG